MSASETRQTDAAFDPYNQPFFSPGEFVRPEYRGSNAVDWIPLIEPRLLVALNEIRAEAGHPILISRAPGSIGRPYGRPSSDHYCNSSEGVLVRAIDVMPYTADPRKEPLSRKAAHRFSTIAIDRGVNAVGVYPNWWPYAGFHLGIREQDRVAKWGRIDKVYTTFSAAMYAWGRG